MSDYVLPEEVMLCVLIRLPVESLLRFKSVCKHWRELFGTRKFMKMHYDQFSSAPQNQKFIVYTHNTEDVYDESLYFVSIDSGAVKPTYVDLPFDSIIDQDAGPKRFVGCCYGLFCIGLSCGYVLWNPALSLFKGVFTRSFFHMKRSCGFVYDAEGDDFKIVSILLTGENRPLRVEVFSNNSDSWETIEVGFQFRTLSPKNNAIFNGNAYWVADVAGDDPGESALGLVKFDATKMEFERVSISSIEMGDRRNAHLQVVDWKGYLGVLAFTITNNSQNFLLKSVDVWVKKNEGEMIWTKIHRFEPRGMEMRVVMSGFLQCCKSGKVVEYVDGNLFVADSETGLVKCVEISSDVAVPVYSDMCGYNEGLAYVGGMKCYFDRAQLSDPYQVQFRESVDDFLEDLRMHGVI